MWNFTWKRILRNPIPAVGVLLFVVAIAVVLQSLHNSKQEAYENYEEICRQIHVTCTVTDLRGTKSDGLSMSNIILSEFVEFEWSVGESKILPFIEDVQIKSQHRLSGFKEDRMLVGITSITMAPELWPENGCTIIWRDGYDEAIFEKNALVCVIPQKLAEEMEKEGAQTDRIPVHLKLEDAYSFSQIEPGDFAGTMLVAGVYSGGDQKTVYCAWETLMRIWNEMGQIESATALRATLKNNDQVEELRQAASAYFAEPDPNADPTDMRLALDIDDSKLLQADQTLRNSLRVNELSELLVFILSAGVGFLIGFLMVRNRKKEIALMRTMGTPNRSIYGCFVSEQMLCVALGIALGGSYNAWQPADRLGILAATYFVGLTIALLIFLRKNLLTTIKEDE